MHNWCVCAGVCMCVFDGAPGGGSNGGGNLVAAVLYASFHG